MDQQIAVGIVLPCRDEAESIIKILEKIQNTFLKFEYEIFLQICFVNDHSQDDSWQVITQLSQVKRKNLSKTVEFEVVGLNLENHTGKSQAQAQGIRAVAGICDHVIILDSDGQHDVSDMPSIICNLVRNQKTLVGKRSGYKRRWIEATTMWIFSRLNKLMGIRFDPDWSEYIGLPSSRARYLSKLPQFGTVPLTSLVLMTYPDSEFFPTKVLNRIDGSQVSKRWSLKSLYMKALLHLFCDPWAFFPRLILASVIPVLLTFLYCIWVGVQAIQTGQLTGITSIILIVCLLNFIQILLTLILMAVFFVSQKVRN